MGTEARGHTTSYRHAGTILRRTSSDVMMAVTGLTLFIVWHHTQNEMMHIRPGVGLFMTRQSIDRSGPCKERMDREGVMMVTEAERLPCCRLS